MRPNGGDGGKAIVFNKIYLDPVGAEFVQYGIPQDGRTASVRVSVRF